MKTQEYKATFFNFCLVFLLLFSCDGGKDNKEDYKYEDLYIATEENIAATLYRTIDTNFLDFELDGIKYTLIEFKRDGGSSIYNLYATDAKSWSEHNDMRNENKAVFNIRFAFGSQLLEMDVLSFGSGYTSDYDVLSENMAYEKLER